jgi:hypothetical protein
MQAVMEMNVQLTIQTLRDRSVMLREMIDKGEVGLAGHVRCGQWQGCILRVTVVSQPDESVHQYPRDPIA